MQKRVKQAWIVVRRRDIDSEASSARGLLILCGGVSEMD